MYLHKCIEFGVFLSQVDIHLEDQAVMVATVMEDIHPEVVAMPRPTEDTNIKYPSRCSDICTCTYVAYTTKRECIGQRFS